MSLQRHRQKGDFGATPSQRGAGASAAAQRLRFVVEKHATGSPHFDFRLEIDGVLKGWALPTDPTGEPPGAKHLAMHTDDHALACADSAATGYGGVPGDAWDRGTWIPEGSPLAGFRRGTLKFELRGRRMKGRWMLTRTGNASTRKKDLWLLVKRAAEEERP